MIDAKDEHGMGFSHEELVATSFILMFGGPFFVVVMY
jgi:hypothetical protein